MSIWHIYTDGSASPNPGPGGAGAIFYIDGESTGTMVITGGHTTNNIMELTAIIEAIKMIPLDEKAIIHTDSNYAVQGINSWSKGWVKRGWKNAKGKPVENQELWKELLSVLEIHPNVSLEWVKAHCGIKGNEEADRLANIGTERSKQMT